MMSNANGKVAVVAVVGRTNAGKSTLINALVGEKVTIVSPVEQTTRNTVRGIVADPRGQLVLLDTPGLHKAVGELGRLLNRMARRTAAGADVLCVVFDASQEPQMEDTGWMQRVAKEAPEKVLFVLNKADKSPFFEERFREEWAAASSQSPHQSKIAWVKASSISEEGVKDVLGSLFDFAEPGEMLFPEEIVTDYPRRFAIADVIREKFLVHLHQELPHEFAVAVKEIAESHGAKSASEEWLVKADILVNRASQRPIVIGRGAETIKKARHAAERELKEIFGLKVRLELWVRVVADWMKNPRILAEMGYMGQEI